MRDNKVPIEDPGNLRDQCESKSVSLKTLDGNINISVRWQDIPVNYSLHSSPIHSTKLSWTKIFISALMQEVQNCWHIFHGRFTSWYIIHFSSSITFVLRITQFLTIKANSDSPVQLICSYEIQRSNFLVKSNASRRRLTVARWTLKVPSVFGTDGFGVIFMVSASSMIFTAFVSVLEFQKPWTMYAVINCICP